MAEKSLATKSSPHGEMAEAVRFEPLSEPKASL
jgi:hypothetical protein